MQCFSCLIGHYRKESWFQRIGITKILRRKHNLQENVGETEQVSKLWVVVLEKSSFWNEEFLLVVTLLFETAWGTFSHQTIQSFNS